MLYSFGKVSYNGIVDDAAKFLQDNQLIDEELWELTIEQFERQSDIHDSGWRGEFWGKLMRGGSLTYRYTSSQKLYNVLEASVRKMLRAEDNKGRFTTYSDSTEFQSWDMWCRKYVLLGFLYFYDICRDEKLKQEILSASSKHLDYIISKIGNCENKTEITSTSTIWQGVNSSSVLEPVVMLYNLTGRQEYIDFAKYIIDNGGAAEYNIFETAYENRLKPYECPVRKAYELISCFEGLVEYYKVSGEKKWLVAAENFASQIMDCEVTVIGSAGCEHELFNNSVLMQTYTKSKETRMNETCVTVTWMKFCYKLFTLTGKSKYIDMIEKSAYNALYGTLNTNRVTSDDKTVFDKPYFRDVYDANAIIKSDYNAGAQVVDSYSPLRRGVRGRAIGGFRPMRDNTRYVGCCIAIAAAGTALAPLVSVMGDAEGAVFNLYIPGKAEVTNDNGTKLSFSIDTNYPETGNVKIKVDDANETFNKVKLRIPDFAVNTGILLNGRELTDVKSGEYFHIKGVNSGDTIELSFDMSPRILYGRENAEDSESKNHIAVMYGPLVMARDARLGNVGDRIKISDEIITVKPVSRKELNAQCVLEVEIDNNKFEMIDYASAGKTWRCDSEFEAWMPIVKV